MLNQIIQKKRLQSQRASLNALDHYAAIQEEYQQQIM